MSDEKKQLLNKFKKYAEENRFLVTGGVVLIILLIVLVIVYWKIYFSSDSNKSNLATSQNGTKIQAEVLPQSKRLNTKTTAKSSTSTVTKISDMISIGDPFAAQLTLKGVVISGNGRNVAIIEGNGSTYVAGIGETIDGNWKVEKIDRNSVTLTADNRERVLNLENVSGD